MISESLLGFLVDPRQALDGSTIRLRGAPKTSPPDAHAGGTVVLRGWWRLVLVELASAHRTLPLLLDVLHDSDNEPPRGTGRDLVPNLHDATRLCQHAIDRHMARFAGLLGLTSRFEPPSSGQPAIDPRTTGSTRRYLRALTRRVIGGRILLRRKFRARVFRRIALHWLPTQA